jgi:hypothetical protein
MEIHVRLDLDDVAVERLVASFGPTVNPGQSQEQALAAVAEGVARAAFEEYVLYLTGARVPAGIRDLRELRLRLLSKHLPDGVPRDVQVAALFHLTGSQARNLLAGTRARYPDDFETLFKETAKVALRGAEKLENGRIRITMSRSLAAFIRDLLTESVAPAPTPLTDASGRYDLAPSTVEDLCRRLDLDQDEVGSAVGE